MAAAVGSETTEMAPLAALRLRALGRGAGLTHPGHGWPRCGFAGLGGGSRDVSIANDGDSIHDTHADTHVFGVVHGER